MSNWKALMEQHDRLKSQSASKLYDRISLLVRINEDPDFREEMKKQGKNVNAELDNRVSDTCASFVELCRMLNMFPSRELWEQGDLASMRRVMVESLREQVKNNKKDDSPKLSWKEKYLELERKYNELLTQYQMLEKNHNELRTLLERKLSAA